MPVRTVFFQDGDGNDLTVKLSEFSQGVVHQISDVALLEANGFPNVLIDGSYDAG